MAEVEEVAQPPPEQQQQGPSLPELDEAVREGGNVKGNGTPAEEREEATAQPEEDRELETPAPASNEGTPDPVTLTDNETTNEEAMCSPQDSEGVVTKEDAVDSREGVDSPQVGVVTEEDSREGVSSPQEGVITEEDVVDPQEGVVTEKEAVASPQEGVVTKEEAVISSQEGVVSEDDDDEYATPTEDSETEGGMVDHRRERTGSSEDEEEEIEGVGGGVSLEGDEVDSEIGRAHV